MLEAHRLAVAEVVAGALVPPRLARRFGAVQERPRHRLVAVRLREAQRQRGPGPEAVVHAVLLIAEVDRLAVRLECGDVAVLAPLAMKEVHTLVLHPLVDRLAALRADVDVLVVDEVDAHRHVGGGRDGGGQRGRRATGDAGDGLRPAVLITRGGVHRHVERALPARRRSLPLAGPPAARDHRARSQPRSGRGQQGAAACPAVGRPRAAALLAMVPTAG